MRATKKILEKMIGLKGSEVCLFAQTGEIIYCSPVFSDLLIVGEDEAVPQNKEGCYTPIWLCKALADESVFKIEQVLAAIWQGEVEQDTLEFSVHETFFIQFSFKGVRRVGNVEGRPSAMVMSVKDITAQIKDRSDFLMSSLVHHSPQPVALITEQGSILRANGAFLDLCALSEKELEGKSVMDLVDLDVEDVERMKQGEFKRFYDKQMLVSTKHHFPVEVVLGSYQLQSAITPLYYILIQDLRSWQDREALKRRMTIMARQRSISAELHDNVAQVLVLLKMRFEELVVSIGHKIPPSSVQKVVGCQQLLDEAHGEMRQMIRYLREEASVREEDCLWGVSDVLRYAHRVLELEIIDMGLANLNLLNDAALYQVAQILREIFYNIYKHADASAVWLTVLKDGVNLIVQVTDKGKGFDVAKVDKKSRYGLTILSERLKDLGGELIVRSAENEGCEVTFKVPIEQELEWVS